MKGRGFDSQRSMIGTQRVAAFVEPGGQRCCSANADRDRVQRARVHDRPLAASYSTPGSSIL